MSRNPIQLIDLDHQTLSFKMLASAIVEHKESTLEQLPNLQFVIYQHLDHRNGIKLTREPTKVYKRDATAAIPLDQRKESIGDYTPMAYNLILRSAVILRGTFYLLEKKYAGTLPVRINSALNKSLLELITAIDETKDVSQLVAIEKAFNFEILDILRQARFLDVESSRMTTKSLANFLINLRYMGSLLTEKPTVITTSKSPGGIEITQTSEPICQKTSEQIAKIKEYIAKHYNANDPLSRLYREFESELKSPDTMVSPQVRATMPYGVRQAYCETTEFKDAGGTEHKKQFVRTASTAFVGDRLTEAEKITAAELNMQQIQDFLAKKQGGKAPAIHHMPLLENTKWRHKQDVMCNIMSKAAKSKFSFSLMPVSFFAMIGRLLGFYKPKLDESLAKVQQKQSTGFTQKQRMRYASSVINKATDAKINEVIVFGCASNQNRAGTLYLAVSAYFIKLKGLFTKTKKSATHFVQTGHELFTSSLTAPGSMGMKQKSRVSGLFSEQCQNHLYGGASASRTEALLPANAKEKLESLQSERSRNRRSSSNHGCFFKEQQSILHEQPLDVTPEFLLLSMI